MHAPHPLRGWLGLQAAALVLSSAFVLHAQPATRPAPVAPAASPGESAITDAEIKDVVNRVVKHQLREVKDGDYKPVASLSEVTREQAPQGITWSYPWGVTLYGILRSTDATGNEDARRFVLNHNGVIARNFAYLMSLQPKATNDAEWRALRDNRPLVPIRPLISLGHLDSCGAMGVQFLESMLRHPEQVTDEHKAVASRIANWITERQQRLPDGTFSRPAMGGTLWIDDLYMGCPYLVRWAKFTGESRHLTDAARNIVTMTSRVQDKDGLMFHAYFFNEQKPSPIKWGRGNGWVAVAAAEVLSELPEDHPDRARVLEVYRRHMAGLKPLQQASGMWRQILDQESWEETSCTAMFAYAMARGVNRGWLDASYLPIARKAFQGVSKQVTPEGLVNGTCQGTNIGMDSNYYLNRERPVNDHHGPGVVLLAGAELLLAGQK